MNLEDGKYIYLTFDDDPARYTQDTLLCLKKYNVPATFFVMPRQHSGDLLNQILNEGHTLGVHTASHDPHKIYSNTKAYLDDFNEAYDLIVSLTGCRPEIFRFPYGSKNSYNADVRDGIIENLAKRGFVYFDWNIHSRDTSGASKEEIIGAVLDGVKKNSRSIVLMHNHQQNTALALECIIKTLLSDSKGYKFGKLGTNVSPIHF